MWKILCMMMCVVGSAAIAQDKPEGEPVVIKLEPSNPSDGSLKVETMAQAKQNLRAARQAYAKAKRLNKQAQLSLDKSNGLIAAGKLNEAAQASEHVKRLHEFSQQEFEKAKKWIEASYDFVSKSKGDFSALVKEVFAERPSALELIGAQALSLTPENEDEIVAEKDIKPIEQCKFRIIDIPEGVHVVVKRGAQTLFEVNGDAMEKIEVLLTDEEVIYTRHGEEIMGILDYRRFKLK